MKYIYTIIAIIAFLIPSVSMGQGITNGYGGTGFTSWLAGLIPYGNDGISATTTSLFNYASSTSRLSVPNINISGTASTSILCLTSDTCRSTWPTSGSGGSGNVSTSSAETANNVAFWSSTNATPALLGSDNDFQWDAAGNIFSVTGTGSFSGLVELLSGAKFNAGGTATISYGNPTLALTSPDSISLTAGSIALNIDGTEGVYVANNQAYRAKDTGGSSRDLIKLDTSDIVNVGNSSSETTILGTNTRISGLSDGCVTSVSTVIGTQTCGVGIVGSGTTGQFPYYAGSGTTLTATSTVFVSTDSSVGIGSTTPWAKLSVTNTGTGASFAVEDSASPDATPFVVDASGNVGIGIAAPSATLDVVSGTTGTVRAAIFEGWSSGVSRFVFNNNVGLSLASSRSVNWSSGSNPTTGLDSGFSRIGVGVIAAGNGTVSDTSGTLIARTIGVGTSTPVANFQATTATANATTSIQFGKPNQNKGTCRTEYDTAGSPVYIYIAAGATSYTFQNGGTAPSGCRN